METSQFVSISLTTGYFDVNDCADLVSTRKDGVWLFTYPISHHSAMVLLISWNLEAFSMLLYPLTEFLLYFDYATFICDNFLYRYLQFTVLAPCCVKVSIFFFKTTITFLYLLLFDVCPPWHMCGVGNTVSWSSSFLQCGS